MDNKREGLFYYRGETGGACTREGMHDAKWFFQQITVVISGKFSEISFEYDYCLPWIRMYIMMRMCIVIFIWTKNAESFAYSIAKELQVRNYDHLEPTQWLIASYSSPT